MINPNDEKKLIRLVNSLIGLLLVLVVTLSALFFWMLFRENHPENSNLIVLDSAVNPSITIKAIDTEEGQWVAPDLTLEKDKALQKTLLYGQQLIQNTSIYLGPKGTVAQITNGMNCQNCHLNAGTQPWGNNYSAVNANYPKFRARSGTVETVYKRISDCFERSLNGKAPDSTSKEMVAMATYIKWLGKDVEKDKKPKGSGIYNLAFLDRPIDPEKGKIIYDLKCKSCHQSDGQGVMNDEKNAYTYPPLWGKNSYNSGAGLYRMSRFAGYVKANMPLGATYKNPQLTDEEAWDVAAFVNSQERPNKDLSKDWPDISKKIFDHPFGPFADSYTEKQHKYGPFQPIVDFQNKNKR
jgi:thiosulfate dehydrogenase